MPSAKTSKALGWSAFEQLGRQLLYFITSVVMARLLSPEEFGVVALLLIFSGLAQIFVDGGMSAALIQRRNTTHDDECTVFWFNIASGTICSLIVFLISWPLANFYQIPELVLIAQINALQIFIGSTGSIHGTKFTKNLDFKRPFLLKMSTGVISGAVGIWMAYTGWGVWSLVIPGLLGTLVYSTLIWKISSWRPRLVFRKESFRSLFKFGGFYFAARCLDVAYQRGYGLLLGKWYGPAELGLYNRADSTQKLPSKTITSVISRVAFPLFSAANDDAKRLRSGFGKALKWAGIINTPVMFGLTATAYPLVEAVYGDQWLPCVPILQILALSGVFWPLHLLNVSLLQALGHSNKMLKLAFIKKSLGLLLLLGGLRYGVLGLACGSLASSIVSVWINCYYSRRYIDFGMVKQLLAMSLSFIGSILMAGIVFNCSFFFDVGPFLEFFYLVAIGAAFYFLFFAIFAKEDLRELAEVARKFRAKNF